MATDSTLAVQAFRDRIFREWNVLIEDDALLEKTHISTNERRDGRFTRTLFVPGRVSVVRFFSSNGKLLDVQSFAA
jgi:hypothetical protein